MSRIALLLSLGATAVAAGDRPPGVAGKSGRSPAMATNGMVAACHPLAAQVGLDVLKRDGNAIDAAIATNAALGVLEPMSCGIGGDLFAIVWDAKTQKLYGLNASGRAPGRATRQYFRAHGHATIPTAGPLSWSVPGCVDGWDELRRRFGTVPFADLLAPAIKYAEEGAPVPEVIAGYWAASKVLATDPGMIEAFTVPDGAGGRRAPRAGEVVTNRPLAASYRLIAAGGRDAFYKGPIAETIIALSDKAGGLFSADDFRSHTSTWVDPVSTAYRGYDVWELPPPGQGIAALQMLNLLEPYDLKAMGPASADYWHLLVEAKKLAFADRARYYADPAFGKLPVERLIGKDYAAGRRKLIDMAKAMADPPAGNVGANLSDTTYLCAVDKDRNCVSLIQSNYMGFGSGLAAPGTGFGLQNRGCLFALADDHPNRLEPGKRPFHTIIPAMLTKAGKPAFVFGVMGGDMQPQGHVQVLVNLLDFGMDVQAAGEVPRVEHVGSATPTGLPGDGVGTVQAEPGLPRAVVRELERRGHVVKRVARNGGGYQGIWIDPATNVLHGGSEHRKDGMAVGY
jgi:gamma-glutamyltranspeptidase/glutathione hydrolase